MVNVNHVCEIPPQPYPDWCLAKQLVTMAWPRWHMTLTITGDSCQASTFHHASTEHRTLGLLIQPCRVSEPSGPLNASCLLFSSLHLGSDSYMGDEAGAIPAISLVYNFPPVQHGRASHFVVWPSGFELQSIVQLCLCLEKFWVPPEPRSPSLWMDVATRTQGLEWDPAHPSVHGLGSPLTLVALDMLGDRNSVTSGGFYYFF